MPPLSLLQRGWGQSCDRASPKTEQSIRGKPVAHLKQITPMVPVADLERAIAFFQTSLGFIATVKMDGYAYLTRDSIAIRLIQTAPGTDTHDPKRQQSCYIDVEGLDGLYAELKPNLDKLPPGRVRAPFTQSYGQREFHVIDEDSLLIFFGESIPNDASQ